MIIVIGHKNPDTDSVISAKILALLFKKEGKDVVARVAGEVNRETEFVFSYFKEDIPPLISEGEKGQFFLVDHNELAQSVAKKEDVCGVLDHHLLAGMKTDKTIFFRVEEVGSTCTLVYKMMKEKGIDCDDKEAGLLLAGILSDTLNLNSPTTTTEDVDSCYELSEISKVEPNEFTEKMFEAKSDLSGKSIDEIVYGDLKEYEFGGKKIVVGVAETTSLLYFIENKKEITEFLKKTKKEKGMDALFFGAVDIVKKNTLFFPAEDDEREVIKKVFRGKEKEEYFLLENVSSRKQEIAPPLSKHYGNNQ